MLTGSGLLDAVWYRTAGEALAPDCDPALHFLEDGWREGRWPNPYFDTSWYLRENPDVARAGMNPLLHYIATGEAAGRNPCPYFDLAWYGGRHVPDPGRTLLAHFLERRHTGWVSPIAEFDPAFYLARYPDIAAAGVDPFEHYLRYGHLEGRDPSADFDTRLYAAIHLGGGALGGGTGENPLLHRRRTMAADLVTLTGSGLFDAAWYGAAGAALEPGCEPARHFLDHGWREGRSPNPYFDLPWYLRENPDVARVGVNPLLHYITTGEAEGRLPCLHFDLAWYATQHRPDPGRPLLAHFLLRRHGTEVSPMADFDPAYYLARYTDIAAAGADPFEHYLLQGYKEWRNPSAEFDTRFYLTRYMDGDIGENPLLHWRRHRHALRMHTRPSPHEANVFEEVRKFARPGQEFEDVQPLREAAPRRAKLLAYYLPQFHAVPENDEWWGKGFTEWTAISRAMPRFAGQYQPRTPRDLGHYRLGTTPDDTSVMRRQIDLARAAGLFGFVQYFYWFNRRRLLEGPLEAFLGDATLDFPFCLMWANENWTRRWDGSEDEVLVAQDYDPADDAALIDEFARHFRDPRYIRLGDRPVLMVYRAGIVPDTQATIARWRGLFQSRHGENPVLVMAQSFGATDPRPFGFDGAIEFPPHKLAAELPRRNREMTWLDPRAEAQVVAYDDVVAASLDEAVPDFPLIKTAVPSWDNDARRQGAGMVLHGSTPAKYQGWMTALIDRAQLHPFLGENIVCVNAWNEWAEGAYLEPDVHFGAAYLNATARAVSGLAAAPAPRRLLLVGHDAFPAGAQLLLLYLLRELRSKRDLEVEYLLLGDGALAGDYAAAAPGMVFAGDEAELNQRIADWRRRGFVHAIVNSAASARIVPGLAAAGIATTLLAHELPRLIHERGPAEPARAACVAAERLIFPAEAVRDGFAGLAPFDPTKARIMPQGCYRPAIFSAEARARLREELGLPSHVALVLGAGYADLRKGFDLFLQAWHAARRRRAEAVFCWLGDMDPALRVYLAPEIDAAQATGTFRLPGFRADVGEWFSAGDVFALTSREDPFPSVVLEAMSAGLPTIAFAGSGGIPAMLEAGQCGGVVPMADADAMAARLIDVAADELAFGGRARLAELAGARFGFDRYADALLRDVFGESVDISVAVPSYNYARYLPRRLSSIFAQSQPVSEVIVLDDASTDASLDAARDTATAWQRDIVLVANEINSGSVFRQWRRAAEMARGEFLWIAEADDEADPAFLSTLSAALRRTPCVDLAFTDSRAIDGEGKLIWPSYRDYYLQSDAAALTGDGIFAARDFARRFLGQRNLILNASAVLWRRSALLGALARCGTELDRYRMAGDWRIYVELLAESDGHVAYVAKPLNAHRRHAASVTHTLDAGEHVVEIGLVHAAIRARLGLNDADQETYRHEVRRQLVTA